MTECRNPELQDLLPDYLSESLGDADRVRVAAHVSACAACNADLAMLRQVRAARRLVAPIDVARIVAALPSPPSRVEARPTLTLHTNPPSVVDARPARSTQRALQGTSLWRLAAVLGVVVAGGMSVVIARRGIEAVQGTPGLSPESVAVVASTPPSTLAAVPESGQVVVSAPKSGASVPVSYGDLGNYTEDELKAMLDRLDKWDGASSTEPMPTLPMVAVRGGSLQ